MRRKQIFTPVDIIDLTSEKYLINTEAEAKPIEFDLPDSYAGPSSAEIEAEIAQLRQDWYNEQELLLQGSAKEAEQLKIDAEEQIEQRRQQLADELAQQQQQQQLELEEQRQQQEDQLLLQRQEVEQQLEQLKNEALEQGQQHGYEESFRRGEDELKRLVAQLHRIISATLQRREEVIAALEGELLDLVFIVIRKVIKRLSSEAQDIIVYNISEALAHLRSRCSVTIHIHPDDLSLVDSKKQEFIDLIEQLQGLVLLEDSSIDRGGCLIETDFGEIDATIAGQLRSIEDRVRTNRPLRSQLSGKRAALNSKDSRDAQAPAASALSSDSEGSDSDSGDKSSNDSSS